MQAEELIEQLEALTAHVRNTKETYAFADLRPLPDIRWLFEYCRTEESQLKVLKLRVGTLLAYCGEGLIRLLQANYPDDLLRGQGIFINPKEQTLDLTPYEKPLILLDRKGADLCLSGETPYPQPQVYGNPKRRVLVLNGSIEAHGHALVHAIGHSHVHAHDFSQVTGQDQASIAYKGYSRGSFAQGHCRFSVSDHALYTDTETATTYMSLYHGDELIQRCTEAGNQYTLRYRPLIPFDDQPWEKLPLQSDIERQAMDELFRQTLQPKLYLPQHYTYNPRAITFEELKEKLLTLEMEYIDGDQSALLIQTSSNPYALLHALLTENYLCHFMRSPKFHELLRTYYTSEELAKEQIYLFDLSHTLSSIQGKAFIGAHNIVNQPSGTIAYYHEKAVGAVRHSQATFEDQTIGFVEGVDTYSGGNSVVIGKDSRIYAYEKSLVSAYGNSRCVLHQTSLCLSHDQTIVHNKQQSTTIQYGDSKVLAESGTVYGDRTNLKGNSEVRIITQPEEVQKARQIGKTPEWTQTSRPRTQRRRSR